MFSVQNCQEIALYPQFANNPLFLVALSEELQTKNPNQNFTQSAVYNIQNTGLQNNPSPY
jgi:hypothetical protein